MNLKTSPVRRLLPKLALVQAIIVTAILLTNIAIHSALGSEQAAEDKLSLVRRQSALVQQIAKSAILSVDSANPYFTQHYADAEQLQRKSLEELSKSLDEWRSDRNQLLNRDSKSALFSMSPEGADQLGQSEAAFGSIVTASENILNALENGGNAAVDKELSTLLQAESVYREQMESLASLERIGNSFPDRRLQEIIWIASAIILATLFAIGRFIFRPMAREMQEAFDELEAKSEHLSDQNTEITLLQEAQEEQTAKLIESESRAIDEAEKAVANLRIAEHAGRRFQELFQGLPVACFTVNCEGLIHEWNGAAEEYFGLPGHAVFLRKLCDALPCFKPKEGQTQQCEIQSAFQGTACNGSERHFVTPSGEEKWIFSNAFPLHGANGEIIGALCASFDITQRKLGEERIRLAEERLRCVIQAAGDSILTLDGEGLVLSCNQAAETLFKQPQDAVVGEHVSTLIHISFEDLLVKFAEPSTVSEGSDTLEETIAFRPDGTEVPVELSLSRGYANDEVFFTCIVRDISQRRELELQLSMQAASVNDMLLKLEMQAIDLQEANQRLESLATIDGLTGLLNHRTLREMLDDEFVAAKGGGELAMVLLDIDHFKSFNDTFGHQAGDAVLKIVAEIVHTRTGDKGYAARYGGEEFAVILPGIDTTGAVAVAEKIRRAIENYPCEYRQITASFGVAKVDETTQRPEQLIELADQALYASKDAGRNRVTVSGSRVNAA
ncbi:MAG: diguanylate cyclase [Fimbriimonadaceae bacterium]|nr:diguanylate cyclase [Fimbriimonadaceae bacterium]